MRRIAIYILKRFLAMGVMILVLSFISFSLLALTPGNIIDILLANRPSTPALIASLKSQYHLNYSFLQQFWVWFRGAMHLNFGTSLQTSEPVLSAIRSSFPITASLAGSAFVLVMIFGVLLGVIAAKHRDGLLDRIVVGGAVMGVCAPVFATGLVLIYLFAARLRWLPAFGIGSGVGGYATHLVMPAITLALSGGAIVVRLVRNGVSDALEQDYVAFARARGMSETTVLWRYGLRNALIPVVTSGGLILSYLFTSTVLVEYVFGLNGLGTLLVQSVESKDLPVVQALVLVFAVAIMVINLVVDFLYLLIDPRIRLQRIQK